MAPKVASKAKKPATPIPEPEDKSIAPDLSSVVAELRSSDVEAQQQALTRLFAIREYVGAKVAVSSSELVTSLLVLASSDTNEVQVLSTHCLARFAAWQGVAQQAICNFSSAESLWKSCFINTKLAVGVPKVLSKEFLEGCLRCMATMCFASPHVLQGLSTLSTAPLCALYQHTSPKIQERACQLTSALAMNAAACSSFVPDGTLGASQVLLQLLKGAGASTHSNTRAEEHAALLLCMMVQTQPHAATQVYEGDGLQTILALLPTPYDGPSASDAAAAATATAGTELLPPFPTAVQLPAVQCLQELAKEPAFVTLLLVSPLLKQLAKATTSESETLRLDRDRLAQSQDALTRRCQQLESETTRVQQMLATRNAALKEELGLQTAYSQCLADLSAAHSKLDKMASQTELEKNDMHQKLKHTNPAGSLPSDERDKGSV
ncbi:hypothetical protein WJX79_002013 [Trebouxia sp. C0005]